MTEIVKASLENGIQKSHHGRQRLPSSPYPASKGIPAEITFHHCNPFKLLQGNPFLKKKEF